MCANSAALVRWLKRPMVLKFAEWKDIVATEKSHRAKIRKMLYRIQVRSIKLRPTNWRASWHLEPARPTY